jgi:hypothetical protein
MVSNPVDLRLIDELARTDPLWQQVLNQEENTPQIKLFSLMSGITDARVFVLDTLAIYEANSEKLVAHKMRRQGEIFERRRDSSSLGKTLS